MCKTIVAIATAYGVGSIAIVRLSGTNALQIAKKISKKSEIKPRYVHLTLLYDSEVNIIDEAILIYFKAPHSFTGEDVVEFQCHGGLVVANQIVDLACLYGARLATAGEYSKRAFLNGKIDLTQAEAIAKLIEAKSVDAAKILARQLQGSLLTFVEESRDMLLLALAHAEVMIDYGEEDLPTDIIELMFDKIDSLEAKLTQLLESSHRRKGLIDGFRVAIVGKPNVGKSSLLNALLDYDRAIVSDIAGTTRDTIEEQVRIGTHIIRLIDTAGIREANDEIERIGVERSVASLDDADIVIAVFDGSRPWDAEDTHILSKLQDIDSNKSILKVLNKVDLPRRLQHPYLDKGILEMSLRGDCSILTKKLQTILDEISSPEELMLVSSRQIEAVKQTLLATKEAKIPLEQGELELFAFHLNDAIKSLSSISKPYDNEDMLDKMFGEFCLGK
ncbi:MAG TPA: tRNA uridine-5-carboxymethylaminomethyl(34) synthesis GTPase MnmE [Epsilonproteobacteria bacterium]|nr:tRNA uridine-5-carboxymethylaminomethyl(34) synthesis GTPase MnmE [Campylobacterota bacterium]